MKRAWPASFFSKFFVECYNYTGVPAYGEKRKSQKPFTQRFVTPPGCIEVFIQSM